MRFVWFGASTPNAILLPGSSPAVGLRLAGAPGIASVSAPGVFYAHRGSMGIVSGRVQLGAYLCTLHDVRPGGLDGRPVLWSVFCVPQAHATLAATANGTAPLPYRPYRMSTPAAMTRISRKGTMPHKMSQTPSRSKPKLRVSLLAEPARSEDAAWPHARHNREGAAHAARDSGGPGWSRPGHGISPPGRPSTP